MPSRRRITLWMIALLLLTSCAGQAPEIADPASAPASAASSIAATPPSTPTLIAPASPDPSISAATSTTETVETSTATGEAPASSTNPAPALTRSLALQEPRLEGEDVQRAQTRLVELGYTQVGAADGIFGPLTDAATRTFQAVNGLVVDGIIGPQTWQRLFAADATTADALAPIVAAESGWLIGASAGDRWIDGPTIGPLLTTGTAYSMYNLEGVQGTFTGGAAAATTPEICPDALRVELTPDPATEHAVLLGGNWEALPRPVVDEPAATRDPQYTQTIADLLREQGIDQADVQITRVVRADLDGDGTDEIILNATRYATAEVGPAPTVAAGDYSLVTVLRQRDGTLEALHVVGEYYPEAIEFAAPNIYTLTAALDLNNDGRMELVVESDYYEGSATAAYELNDAQLDEVLIVGCGV